MSINYVRDILKISLSQLCTSIGYDQTSEICLDILIEICERQFEYLFKQINRQNQLNFEQIFFLFFEKHFENFHLFQNYLNQFQSIQFTNDIIRFPYRKKHHIFLRIPPKYSIECLQRDQNQNTEYIYDWLPLFPDQETPEQTSQINLETSTDQTLAIDQDKTVSKDSNHHPLTLLSFLNENHDQINENPQGKKANRSVPKIVYRPRRLIEIDAAVAAAEKAKKDLLEKENIEKEQAFSSQPPLRLTIPKPQINDKPTSPIKKQNQIISEKKSFISSTSNNNNNNNLLFNKKLLSSPNQSIEINHNPQPILSTSNENLTTNEKLDQTPIDLSKPTTQLNKLPTLKLNFKNVPPPPPPTTTTTTNSDNPPTATKKVSKPSTTTSEKVNLKIRTSSLPLLGTNSNSSLITSPNLSLSTDHQTSISQPTSQNLSQNDDEKKKQKKKKKYEHENEEKKFKKDPEDISKTNTINQQTPMDTNPIGGAIKLKIKLGKPTNISPPEDQQQQQVSSTTIQPEKSNPIPPMNSIRLKLPVNPLATNVNKKKSIKIKDIEDKLDVQMLINEDNTNSIDDLPLGERTISPAKHLLSTSIKKPKLISNKKKINSNKKNNIGVAVIEERRIHHDSQEKIWICPSCNRPDNGQEAMIACDLCDDWYHWECVGIIEEPPESISWFCPKCHRSNSSTTSAQSIKPSASTKAKRQRASILFQQKQQQQQQHID